MCVHVRVHVSVYLSVCLPTCLHSFICDMTPSWWSWQSNTHISHHVVTFQCDMTPYRVPWLLHMWHDIISSYVIRLIHWKSIVYVFQCVVDDMGGYFAPFPMQNTLHLRVYKHKRGRFLSKNEFQQPESCVSLLPAKACAGTYIHTYVHAYTHTHTHTHTALGNRKSARIVETENSRTYRVAKMRKMPYLYRSFAAKESYS